MNVSADNKGAIVYDNALRFVYWSVIPWTYAFFMSKAVNQDCAGV